MEEKKNILTYSGLKKLEDELQDLKVNQRKMIAQKIKEAREQGDLSENAEYDAAKDEQRDIEARIEEIEKILLSASESDFCSFKSVVCLNSLFNKSVADCKSFDFGALEYHVSDIIHASAFCSSGKE